MSRGPTDKANDRGGGAAFLSSAVNISALLKGTESSSMCEFQQQFVRISHNRSRFGEYLP